MIESYGFIQEVHYVLSQDGYILTINRIINLLLTSEQRKALYPVYLQHGIIVDDAFWLITSFES